MTVVTGTRPSPQRARPSAEENCAYVQELLRARHPWLSAALEFLVLDAAAAAGVPRQLPRP